MSSDHIPFKIQSEIIKRLPVKSVVRCRSVSKQWKSLIDSAEFISSYQTQTQNHLLVRYKLASEVEYASIVDDDTFPNQKSSINVPEELVSNLLGNDASIFSSVNGLICFTCSRQDVTDEEIAVLWNPSVRKSVGVTIRSKYFRELDGDTYIGFGVCPNTSDPKLVKISTVGFPTVFNWEVEVFTLSTPIWKSVSNIPPAFRTCHLTSGRVFVDGFIYWRGYDNMELAEGVRSNLIISFDLKSHDFGKVCLPDRLVRCTNPLLVSKVFESLGLIEYYNDRKTRLIDVWIMKEEGITKSFTKILSIKEPDSLASCRVLLELRKNGEVIFENIDDTDSTTIEVYEPSSGHINGIGFYGNVDFFSMNSYMETLLLLDQPNSIIY